MPPRSAQLPDLPARACCPVSRHESRWQLILSLPRRVRPTPLLDLPPARESTAPGPWAQWPLRRRGDHQPLPACADGRTSSTDPSVFPSFQHSNDRPGQSRGPQPVGMGPLPWCKHPAAYAFEHATPVVMVHARRARTRLGVRWRGRLLGPVPAPQDSAVSGPACCLRRFGCCPDGLYVSAPASPAPPSSGPAVREMSLRRSFVADFLREFPAPCPAGRQASVGHSSASFASSQKSTGERGRWPVT